jgi:ribonuclease HII
MKFKLPAFLEKVETPVEGEVALRKYAANPLAFGGECVGRSGSLDLFASAAAGEGESVIVVGVDEVGRGPLAGGVYAAAVSVPLAQADALLDGAWAEINDSKKLTERARARLAEVVKSTPGCTWAVASASPAEIDRLNILYATHLAMKRAADAVAAKLAGDRPPNILVDGLRVSTLPQAQNVVKGDARSLFIAAASILAKTARDADCLRLEKLYPGYGFAQHKGYPTKAHLAALAKLGPCPEHRRSFGPVSQLTLGI